MTTLTVWKFDTAAAAHDALDTLERLQSEAFIRIEDAAVVSWPLENDKPKTWQLRSLVGAGAFGGAFWGFLFGLIFFVPLLGIAVGAAAGAGIGALRDVGIDDDFIAEVREEVTPGTSALFLFTSNAVLDEVSAAFAGERGHAALIRTNLNAEQEQRLREAFAQGPQHALVHH